MKDDQPMTSEEMVAVLREKRRRYLAGELQPKAWYQERVVDIDHVRFLRDLEEEMELGMRLQEEVGVTAMNEIIRDRCAHIHEQRQQRLERLAGREVK